MMTRKLPHNIDGDDEKLVKELLDACISYEQNKPTENCAHSNFLRKQGGRIRMITEFRRLNSNVARVDWPFPSSEKIMLIILPHLQLFFC